MENDKILDCSAAPDLGSDGQAGSLGDTVPRSDGFQRQTGAIHFASNVGASSGFGTWPGLVFDPSFFHEIDKGQANEVFDHPFSDLTLAEVEAAGTLTSLAVQLAELCSKSDDIMHEAALAQLAPSFFCRLGHFLRQGNNRTILHKALDDCQAMLSLELPSEIDEYASESADWPDGIRRARLLIDAMTQPESGLEARRMKSQVLHGEYLAKGRQKDAVRTGDPYGG